MGNPFVHVELHTKDPGAAKAFYGKLFDWRMEEYPDYTVINVGSGTGGGITKGPSAEALPQWLPYIAVDDIDTYVKKAISFGATLLEDKTEIKDMGWFAILVDPTGAAFALWKPRMAD